VELAGGRAPLGAVGLAVDHHPARAADALAAVVLEGDGLLALGDQPLVDRVEHLEEGHVGADALGLLDVGDHLALVAGRLAPDVEGDVDGRVLTVAVAVDTHTHTHLYDLWVSFTYSNSNGSGCILGSLPLPVHSQAAA